MYFFIFRAKMDEIVLRDQIPNVSYHKYQQQQNHYHGFSYNDGVILRREFNAQIDNRYKELKNEDLRMKSQMNEMNNQMNEMEKELIRLRQKILGTEENKNKSFEDEIIKIIKVSLETESNTYKRVGFTDTFNYLKHIFDFKQTKEDIKNIICSRNHNLMIIREKNKDYIVMTKK